MIITAPDRLAIHGPSQPHSTIHVPFNQFSVLLGGCSNHISLVPWREQGTVPKELQGTTACPIETWETTQPPNKAMAPGWEHQKGILMGRSLGWAVSLLTRRSGDRERQDGALQAANISLCPASAWLQQSSPHSAQMHLDPCHMSVSRSWSIPAPTSFAAIAPNLRLSPEDLPWAVFSWPPLHLVGRSGFPSQDHGMARHTSPDTRWMRRTAVS